ncbi:MAG: hypothetical protein KIG65_08515 [Eubacteriales bacterium]|nr:hypothetical protein [Eubacteriales bacterium]
MAVPKPWTDIRTEEFADGIAVEVWGRKYTFKNSLFPTSVISLGKELLYAPVELALKFGSKEREIYGYQYRVMEKSEEKVTVQIAAICENIVVNSAVTFEYDGYVGIALNIAPFGIWSVIKNRPPENGEFDMLERVSLRVKLNKEASTLLHYWPNGEDSIKSEPYVVPSSEYKELELPFKPCVWSGNEEYGLNICMESDEMMQLSDVNKCIKTSMNETYNEIEYTLIDSTPIEWATRPENYVSTHEPLCFDFIIQATPVKEFSRQLENDWRSFHTSWKADNDYEAIAKLGTKWVIFHENWALIQNYGPAVDAEKLKAAVKKCHELGMKTMVYFGYEYATAHPEWNKNHKQYCNINQRGTMTGGWTRSNIHQRDFIVCYNSDYSEEMLSRVDMVMREYGVDGIYTDQTYVPWGCANLKHGCGYTDRNGKLHVTYPINALREHVKKMYAAVHANGGLIDAHQSTCCLMPTLAFADTYFDGENLQELIAKKLNEFVSMEAFRCEFLGRPFGLVCNFVTVLSEGFTMRNLLSLTLIHNVTARAWGRDLDIVSKVWEGYDAIGVVDAKWCPYWEGQSSLKTEDDNVYITTFEKDNKILAFVSQFDKIAKNVEITLPEKFKNARELFDGNTFGIENGKLSVNLENKTSYAFVIE